MRKLTDMSQDYSGTNNKTTSASASTSNKSTSSSFKDFLNSHDIDSRRLPRGIDGNSIQTRKIDLRPNQNQNSVASESSVGKSEKTGESSIELLLKNLLNTMNSNRETRIDFATTPIEPTNMIDSTSSSESDDDDDDTGNEGKNDLWIERYRKQKQAQK